jgi:hypothetical protein
VADRREWFGRGQWLETVPPARGRGLFTADTLADDTDAIAKLAFLCASKYEI